MTANASGLMVTDGGPGDFLFTWKQEHWDYKKLRKLVERFRLRGAAEEWWSCNAHRKIRVGDRAYLLKQGKPIGIFGRGTIMGKPRRRTKNIWEVLIGFDVPRGDILLDPKEDGFLVDENLLLSLPVPKKQWQNQAAGITLEKSAARAIDRKILDLAPIRPGETTSTDDAAQEVARVKSEQLMRPEQRLFSETMRKNYRDKCAVTGCVTPAALEAAHIKPQEGRDDNSPSNGILLRSDIHCLFDRFLITLSEDGTEIETSPELTDPGYAALKGATVSRPVEGPPPSAENIRDHRNRFSERLPQRAGH
ncbi:MAG: HNH endonuclease [Candidatus Acidiferrales bacterium]